MTIEPLVGPLPDGWKYETLGGVCVGGGGSIQTGPFGSQLHKSDYVSVGIPSIMPQNIGDNRIIDQGIARITPADADRLCKYRVQPGDVVYSRRGDVEKRDLVRQREAGWLCGTGCLRVRLGKKGPSPQYAAFYLAHPAVREWISRHAHGATMPNLNTAILSACPFVVPPRTDQDSIASILGALDDKIDLNHRMNETLEAMARALFKDWFVDFGPTRAKMEGREPYLAPDLWALFPDRLDDEDKPEGWPMGTISDICTLVVNGGTPSRSTAAYWVDGDVPWFKTGELTDSFVLDSQEKITQVGVAESSAKILPRDSVIMAIYAAPTVGRLGIFTAPSAFNQACTGMIAKPEIGSWFLYLTLFFGRGWFNDRANGAAQQNISKRIVEGYAVPVADRNLMAAFNGLVTPFFKSVRSNVEQSRTLAQTRDLLLPKLMSGEIRVREAERVVEDVV